MTRKEMIEIVCELMEHLNKKNVSPIEAETISEFLLDEVKKSNESEKKKYMENGIFCGNPPEK